MTTRKLGRWLALALGSVVTVMGVASSGLVPKQTAVVVGDSAQLIAGMAACVLCWRSAATGRLQRPERRWRALMAVGMGGWTVGMALWAWYRTFAATPLPSPSLADVGFFTLPVFAAPALLSLAIEQPRYATSSRRYAYAVFLLDSLVIVGSLFIIAWATALGAVVRAGAPTTSAFVVAIGYPVTDLILVAMVVLLAVTGRVPHQYRPQLWLLGSGLVMLAVSDSVFAYLVSSGAEEMPVIADTGFVAGPALIAFAALVTATGAGATRTDGTQVRVERAHLLLPYVLVAVTGSVIAAQVTLDRSVDAVEVLVAWMVVALVLARQVLTLMENVTLLEQVSSAQAELAYRAQHDPLTGLANRSLLNDRLAGAIERRRQEGRPLALLIVDLDDFKTVNDSLGHAAGDRLLHAVAGRLEGCVRDHDTVARLGGDEFAIVVEGPADAPRIVGERVLTALSEPYRIDGHVVSLGASVGVVARSHEDPDATAEEILRQADGAMYAGKRQGKGLVVEYGAQVLT